MSANPEGCTHPARIHNGGGALRCLVCGQTLKPDKPKKPAKKPKGEKEPEDATDT